MGVRANTIDSFINDGDHAVEYGQRVSHFFDYVKRLKYQKVTPAKRDESRETAQSTSDEASRSDSQQMLGLLDGLAGTMKLVGVPGSSALPGRPRNKTPIRR